MMATLMRKPLSMDDQLAAISGIVTPSKVPAGQKPWRPTETSGNAYPLSTKICIVCGSATMPERVKSHFVACMHANGNPMGAQWWHNFVDAPKQQNDKSHDRWDLHPRLALDHANMTQVLTVHLQWAQMVKCQGQRLSAPVKCIIGMGEP